MASNCTFLNSSYPCNVTTMSPFGNMTTASPSTTTALTDKNKIRIAIYVISIVLSWIGNTLVIMVSVMNRQSLSPCRILMAHLAVANLLFSIRLPFQIRLEMNGSKWEWGLFYCKVMHGFNSASLLASIETVAVIAIERYRGISKPYSSKWTKKHIIISIMIIWAISLITYSPYMYYLNLTGTRCFDTYPSVTMQQTYSIIIFVMRYVIPVGILSYCYFKIGMVIHRRPTRVSTHQNQATEQNRKRENQRVIRILIVIVVAFALLTAPTSVWWLWYDFGGTDTKTALDMIEVFAALLYLHSAINPIIYGIMDQKFKKGVRDLFALCFGMPRLEVDSIAMENRTRMDTVNKRTVTFTANVEK